jgi:hypothetical protein
VSDYFTVSPAYADIQVDFPEYFNLAQFLHNPRCELRESIMSKIRKVIYALQVAFGAFLVMIPTATQGSPLPAATYDVFAGGEISGPGEIGQEIFCCGGFVAGHAYAAAFAQASPAVVSSSTLNDTANSSADVQTHANMDYFFCICGGPNAIVPFVLSATVAASIVGSDPSRPGDSDHGAQAATQLIVNNNVDIFRLDEHADDFSLGSVSEDKDIVEQILFAPSNVPIHVFLKTSAIAHGRDQIANASISSLTIEIDQNFTNREQYSIELSDGVGNTSVAEPPSLMSSIVMIFLVWRLLRLRGVSRMPC